MIAKCRRLVETIEERLGQPFVDEFLDTHRFDVVGQFVIGRPPRRPLRRAGNTWCCADQDQPLDEFGLIEGQLETHPSAHRIADIGAHPALFAQQPGRFRQRRPSVAGVAVSRSVQGDHAVIGGKA